MDANREARELDVTLPDIAPWASEGYNNAKIHSKHRNLSVMNKTQQIITPVRTMHPPGVGDTGEHLKRFSTIDAPS